MRKAKFKESQLGKTRCPACPVQVINSRVERGWILGNLSAGGEGGGAYRDLPQGHICACLLEMAVSTLNRPQMRSQLF